MPDHRLQLYFFLSLFVAVALLGFFIFLPYLSIIAVVASLAVVLNPLNKKLARMLKNYDGLAALLTILATLFIIFLPLVYLGTLAFQEAKSLYIQISNNGNESPGQLFKLLEEQVSAYYPQFSFDFSENLKNLLSLI